MCDLRWNTWLWIDIIKCNKILLETYDLRIWRQHRWTKEKFARLEAFVTQLELDLMKGCDESGEEGPSGIPYVAQWDNLSIRKEQIQIQLSAAGVSWLVESSCQKKLHLSLKCIVELQPPKAKICFWITFHGNTSLIFATAGRFASHP